MKRASAMWRNRKQREHDVRNLQVLRTISETSDQILAMIRDRMPTANIHQAILWAGVASLAVSPDLVYLRIADCATGETKRLITLQSTYASNIPHGLQGITGRAMRTVTSQLIPNVHHDPDYQAIAPGVNSELAVPIVLGGECYGVINFESSQLNWFTAEHLAGAVELARLAALAEAIESERQRAEAGEMSPVRRRRLSELLDSVISLFPPSANVMAEVLGVVTSAQQLITLALRPETSVALYTRLRKEEGKAGLVISTKQPYAGNIDRLHGEVAHLVSTKSELALPILGTEGQLLGVLNLESSVVDTFSQATLAMLSETGLVEQIAESLVGIDLSTLEDEHIVEQLLKEAESQVFRIIDPEDVSGAYHEMLNIAIRLISSPEISGALLLVRDEAQNLTTPVDDHAWMVVTATLGDFSIETLDWHANEPSISRRAISTRTTQRVPRVAEDADYKPNGERFVNGSELVVPLVDAGRAIGVIDLLSPVPETFSERDAQNLGRLAQYTVQAIKRADDINTAHRAEMQLQCAREIHEILAPLFSTVPGDVATVRARIVSRILEWALQHTESVIGIVALAQTTEGHTTELALTDFAGPLLPATKRRWLISEGITGQAFTSGSTQSVPNVGERPYFFPTFADDVKSELAAPMKRGDERVGVLDVQSTDLHHFTMAHKHWLEFLAAQLAFAFTAVSLATTRQGEATIAQLSSAIRRGISEIRGLNMEGVATARNEMRQSLLDRMRQLTGATTAMFLVAANAFDAGETLDSTNGQLVVVNESPAVDRSASGAQSFIITDGLSGLVFHQQRKVVFNRADDKPVDYTALPGQPQRVQSGLAVPIFAGSRVIGVLEFASEEPGTFTPDAVLLSEDAARLAADILVSSRLRIEELQSGMLREFELAILGTRLPDAEEFMLSVLRNAAALTDLAVGWGHISLVRAYPSDPPEVLRPALEYTMLYDGRQGTPERQQVQNDFELDHPRITYGGFLSAIQSKRPVLILDTQRQSQEDQLAMPWPQARSLLCVPLLSPAADDVPSETVVSGLLTIASPTPCNLNESDRDALTLFAQTVSSGLDRVSLLGANAKLTQELAHDFKRTIIPLTDGVARLHASLDELQGARDIEMVQRQLSYLLSLANRLDDLVSLTRDLLTWFFNLTDESAWAIIEEAVPRDVAELVESMRAPIRALAFAMRKSDVPVVVEWQVPPEQLLYVAGGDARENLIRAALFEYIENALNYGEGQSVSVVVESTGDRWVRFLVRSRGPQIPPNEIPMLFERGFRSSSVQGLLAGTGIGLYQVKRIARRLHGEVGYRYESGMNDFLLLLPIVPTTLD